MYLASKRRGDFDCNEVTRIVQSALPCFVLCAQPVGANDGHQRLARRNLIVQSFVEIDSDDIHKEIVLPEYLRQPVVQPAGGADRIFPTIVNENLSGHGPVRSPKPEILP